MSNASDAPTSGREVVAKYVTVKRVAGCTKFTCLRCKKDFTGTLPRQLAHLLGREKSGVQTCIKNSHSPLPAAELDLLLAFANECQSKDKDQSAAVSGAGPSIGGDAAGLSQPKQLAAPGSSKQLLFHQCTKQQQISDADDAVAMCFYGTGMAFNLARTRLFRIMCQKIAQAGPSYKPPGSEKLRTKLLVKVRSRLSRMR
jgi:hypothetical protein